MKGKWLQLVIGLFVLAGLACGMFLILMFGGLSNVREGYRVTGYFDHAGGISIGAPVLMGGIWIGKVTETDFMQDSKGIRVKLVLRIEKGRRIKEDAVLTIDSRGVIGEAFLNFTTGTPKAGFLPTDGSAVVEGGNPPSISSLQEEGYELTKELKEAIKDSRKLIQVWTKAFEGEGTLPKLLKDDRMYRELVELTTNLNRLVQSFEQDPSQVIWGPEDRVRRVEVE